MLLAPHILVGAALATSIPNPLLGLLFAFLSHFLLDRIPHWEYSIEPLKEIRAKGTRYCLSILRRVALDIALGFILVIFAIGLNRGDSSFFLAFAGGFFGILPDGLGALTFVNYPKNKLIFAALKTLYALHQKIHFNKKTGLPVRIGLATQAIAILLALYFLIF